MFYGLQLIYRLNLIKNDQETELPQMSFSPWEIWEIAFFDPCLAHL